VLSRYKKNCMKKIYVFLVMVFIGGGVWGQQVIGSFPTMDGGFEGLIANPVVQTIATGAQTTLWTVSSGGGTATTLSNTGGRSGPQYVIFGTPLSTANKRLQSPTAGNAAIVSATAYTVQYFYRTSGATAPSTAQIGINPDGTGGTITYTATPLSGTSGVWTKFTGSFTPAASAVSPRYGVGIIRYSNISAITTYDIDDYVIYAGAADNTAPNSPGALTVSNPTNSTLDLSWGAASGGVDGGGYVVVRYIANPGATDDPNQNGIYALGNTVTGGVNGTVVYIGTGTGFTDNGLLPNTTYYYKVYTVDKAFNYSAESTGNGTTTAALPQITLSSPSPAVPIANINAGNNNNVIYRFDLAVTTADATLTGVTINTTGSYVASDITNFKCWYSADIIFSAGTDILLSTATTGLGTGSHVFPTFANQTVLAGTSGYFFITTDLPCTAIVANNLTVTAIGTADISFSLGTKSGSASDGGVQTIFAPLANNVTTPAATVANVSSSLSWTNPVGCYDEVLIVARASSANDGTPFGDGTTYTANPTFGSGTPLGSGFVVYKGTVSPQLISGLTNGTPYYYKFFTRIGTTWSSGIEINATPAVVTLATDYFRSVAPGGPWGSISTWESSPDNISWMAATLVPTANANTITIQNTADVTVAATAGGDQITVDAGATLTLNANFTLADGAGTDLIVNGTLNNTLGTLTYSPVTATAIFNANSFYIHNRNGGPIPIATWDILSTVIVTGATTSGPTGMGQTFGNFIWNCIGQSTNVGLGNPAGFAVAGNLTITSTGGVTNKAVRFTSNTAYTASIGGDLILNGGHLGLSSGSGTMGLTVAGNVSVSNSSELYLNQGGSGVGTLNVGGNLSVSTATITETSSAICVINFTKSGTQTFSATLATLSNDIDYNINSTSTLVLNNNIPVNTGRTMTVNGTLDCGILSVNGAGAVIVSNGGRAKLGSLNLTDAVADNISSTGGLSLNTGSTVEFNGLGIQYAAARTFSNMEINNSSGLVLNGTVLVNDLLTFTTGIITSTATNLLSMSSTASVTGASNTSFVSGPVAKTGATGFVFPVGKTGTGYVAVEIASLSGSETFTAEYMRGDALSLGLISAIGLLNVSRCEYWILNRAGSATANVTLYWTSVNNCSAAPYITNLTNLTIAHFDGAGRTWDAFAPAANTTGTTAAGTVTWSDVSIFSPFTLGSVSFINPLAVSLNYLRGVKQGNAHLLNWKVTCASTPSATLSLERSADGTGFKPIYSITADALRCAQPFEYNDAQPLAGTNYYRLKMIDANGKISYSNIITLINASQGFDIMHIAPNPVTGNNFTLNISSAKATQMNIVISDLQGRVMKQASLSLIAGYNTSEINIQSLAPGTYQLYGSNGTDKSKLIRFVKQ